MAIRMERFFQSNPGFRSRIAHHIDFPDYSDAELFAIAELMLDDQNYRFTPDARAAFERYIAARKVQPLFSNARSILAKCARSHPAAPGQSAGVEARPGSDQQRPDVDRGG